MSGRQQSTLSFVLHFPGPRTCPQRCRHVQGWRPSEQRVVPAQVNPTRPALLARGTRGMGHLGEHEVDISSVIWGEVVKAGYAGDEPASRHRVLDIRRMSR